MNAWKYSNNNSSDHAQKNKRAGEKSERIQAIQDTCQKNTPYFIAANMRPNRV